MNILFIHHLEKIGGGERYLVNVINSLPSSYNAYLLTPNSNTELEKHIDRPIKKISKKFIRSFGPFPLLSLALFLEIRKLIKSKDIDVIHILDHYTLPTLVLIKYLYKIKILFSSRGEWDTHFLINRLLLKTLNPITSVNTPIQYFRVKMYVDKKYLMPSFYFMQREFKIKKINRYLNLGIVGRFSPVKNHFFAFELMSQLDSNYKLHVFGSKTLNLNEESDSYEKKVINELKKNKNIIYHGRTTNLEQIYKDIDILLVTSFTESYSMVTVEALSFGVPVITTLTEGSNFLIIDDYNGFICYSKEEFTEKMKIIKNNYERFSENAYNSSKRFAKNKYMSKLIELYEN